MRFITIILLLINIFFGCTDQSKERVDVKKQNTNEINDAINKNDTIEIDSLHKEITLILDSLKVIEPKNILIKEEIQRLENRLKKDIKIYNEVDIRQKSIDSIIENASKK